MSFIWLNLFPHVSQEHIRCVMGYVVGLTVVLDQIFRSTAGIMSVDDGDIASVVDRHIGLQIGRRGMIHQEIRAFVAETFPIRFVNPQTDLVFEKIVDLIRRYCVPLPTTGTHDSDSVNEA